jgi:hypothetical protein
MVAPDRTQQVQQCERIGPARNADYQRFFGEVPRKAVPVHLLLNALQKCIWLSL